MLKKLTAIILSIGIAAQCGVMTAFAVSENTEEVTKAYIMEDNGKINIAYYDNWYTPSNKKRIYRTEDNGTLTMIAEQESANFVLSNWREPYTTYVLDGTLGYFGLTDMGLENGKEYTYIIKTVNSDGVESPGTILTGTPTAADKSDLWKNWNIGVDDTEWTSLKRIAGAGKDGSYGVKFMSIEHSANHDGHDGNHSRLYTDVQLQTNTDYEFSYDINVANYNANGSFRTILNSVTYGEDKTLPAEKGTWQHITIPFSTGNTIADNRIYINSSFYGLIDCNIDNVSLVVSGTTDNLITNGDFEPEANTEEIEKAYTISNDGYNQIVYYDPYHSGQYNDRILYRKENDGSLTKLAQNKSGGWLLNNWSEITKNNAIDSYWGFFGYTDEGLENDREYTYIIKTVDSEGTESAGTVIKSTPHANTQTDDSVQGYRVVVDTYKGWNLTYRTLIGNNSAYAVSTVQSGIGKDDSRALRLMYVEGATGRQPYAWATKHVTLEPDTTYILSYDMKYDRYRSYDGNKLAMQVSISDADNGTAYTIKDISGAEAANFIPSEENTWETMIYTFKTGADAVNANLTFMGEGWVLADGIIDNVSIVKTNDETAENLVAYGDFENKEDDYYETEATGAGIIPGNGYNAVYFKNTGKAKVYKKGVEGNTVMPDPENVEGMPEYAGVIDRDVENGKTYEYIVKMVDTFGDESRGITLTATPGSSASGFKNWNFATSGEYASVTDADGTGKDESRGLMMTALGDGASATASVKVAVLPDTMYQLSYDVKYSEVQKGTGLKVMTGAETHTTDVMPNQANVWENKQLSFFTDEKQTELDLSFTGEGIVGLVVDNVILQAEDDSENIIEHGDFEKDITYDITYYAADSVNDISKEKITTLRADKGVIGTLKVCNYSADASDILLLLAVYNNGKLEELQKALVTVNTSTGDEGEEFSLFTTAHKKFTDGQCEVKLMAWDGVDSMIPLCGTEGIGE